MACYEKELARVFAHATWSAALQCCFDPWSSPEVSHHFVQVRGHRWHVLERGTGPLVLLLHGFPARACCWHAQIDALAAAGFRVVAPDLLGVPPSDQPGEISRYEASALAADLAVLIETLGHERAHVVGHDWGAGLAWELAQSFPERVQSMVSLCVPSPRRMLAGLLDPRQLMRSWYIFFFQLPWVPEYWLARSGLEYFLHDYPAAQREAFLTAIRENGGVGEFTEYYRANVRAALKGKLAQRTVVQAPVLVIAADDDRFVEPSLFALERRWAPRSELVIEKGTNHWLPMEEPGRLHQRLIDFFRASTA